MSKDYIDVEYAEVKQESKPHDDITVNTDPFSAAISGLCGVVNNITSAVKEYNICRQQEETRRAEIRANMKICIAEIDAKKEICMKYLQQRHEIELEQIRNVHELVMKELDSSIDATNAAIEQAKITGDFSSVLPFLECSQRMVQTRCEFTLQYMKINSGTSIDGMLTMNSPRGYLE